MLHSCERYATIWTLMMISLPQTLVAEQCSVGAFTKLLKNSISSDRRSEKFYDFLRARNWLLWFGLSRRAGWTGCEVEYPICMENFNRKNLILVEKLTNRVENISHYTTAKSISPERSRYCREAFTANGVESFWFHSLYKSWSDGARGR